VARHDPQYSLEQEIQRHPLLTPEEEKDLSAKARKGDREARERMIQSNLGLVYSLAKAYNHHDTPLDDLVNEGILGLMEAVKRFDPTKGFRFSTYATHWIKQALRCAVAVHGRAVRISPYMREMTGKMRQAVNRFASEEGREPTDDEIAERMEVPLSSVGLFRKAMVTTVSTDHPVRFENEESLAELIEDKHTALPEEQFLKNADTSTVLRLLDEIGGRGAEVLRMHFGLGRDAMTLVQIGRQMKLTKERVRQIENQAIRKLKRLLKTTPGRD
jgi:RNA polymerase primary sigma factor